MRLFLCLMLICAPAGAAWAQTGPAVQETQVQLKVTYPAAQTGAPVHEPQREQDPRETQLEGEAPQAAPPTPPPVTQSVSSWLFLPAGQGRRPALVFAHDGVSGLTEGEKTRCRDLARAGYVVLAPEYNGDGLGKAVRNRAAIHTFMTARKFLNQHPRVKQNFVGIMGTSQGGYLALQTAIKEMGHWNCVVQASGAIDVPTTRSRVQSRVLLQHGDEDNVVLRKHANYLDATLRKTGTSCELKEYTLLDHNFWFWEGKDYTTEQQQQAGWAWSDVMAFLDDCLKPTGNVGNAK